MRGWKNHFKRSFPVDCWTDDPRELDAYAQDAWPLAQKLGQMGQLPYRPELAFRPRSANQVPLLLAWANRRRVPVTARGAGSDVVGACLPSHGGILLDLSGLNRILLLDGPGLFVKVEAGMLGGALEEQLAGRGYTLHHSPQSLQRSTVGGWVATRASGQFSSRWGSIEDLVLAVTVALADGSVISTPLVPRAALGPDLKSLFIGSEGTLGVVLDVTLKIFPVASHGRLETLSFPSLDQGLRGLQAIMQQGLRPFLARLYDPEESPYVARWSGQSFPPGGSLFLLGFEGLSEVAEAETRAAMAVLAAHGAVPLGAAIAEGWMQNRYDFSSVEQRLAIPGGLAETIEVAHFWGQIGDLHGALKQALAGEVTDVLGHFSHAYPQGASLYMILFGQERDAAAVAERLERIWDIAMRIALDHGAAISHHHGIGLARGSYLPEALGAGHVLLQRLKRTLDPHDILNPGKLAFRR